MPLFSNSDTSQIYYKLSGNLDGNQTIIFISGWTSDHNFWINFLPYFQEYRCITFDNRGVGQTIFDQTKSIMMEDYLNDILGLMEHLSIEQAILFGISMGGMIAQNFALKYPNRCEKLILLSTASWIPPKQKYLFEILVQLEAINHNLYVDLLLGQCYGNKVWMNSSYLKAFEFTRNYKKSHPQLPGNCKKQAEALILHDTRDFLHKIYIPTIIIAGAEDTLLPSSLGLELHKKIVNSKWILLTEEGHIPVDLEFLIHLKDFLSHTT